MSTLKFKDFVPEVIPSQGPKYSPRVKDVDSVISRMNHWLAAHPDHVLVSVETVVLPNINQAGEHGSIDAELRQEWGREDTWHQLLRVWYQS